MRLLCLIPARGNSKRLPGKNIRQLGGRPLIAWSLAAAQESGIFVDIIVSTDSSEISEIANQWGGWVPWLRPKELATDTAKSIDAAIHAIDWYENNFGCVDGVMLLQPTSPFRSSESIRGAAEIFKNCDKNPVVSLSPAAENPAWMFRLNKGVLVPLLGFEGFGARSQDLDSAYTLNGAIFLATPTILRQRKTFITETTVPIIMKNPAEGLDIDNEWDWELAQYIAKDFDKNAKI